MYAIMATGGKQYKVKVDDDLQLQFADGLAQVKVKAISKEAVDAKDKT